MDKATLGRQMVDWLHTLDQKWSTIRFGEMKVETDGKLHDFEVQLYLNEIAPNAVRIELYAEGVKGTAPVRQVMTRRRAVDGANNVHLYGARVSAALAVSDYTARVIPNPTGIAVPLEFTRILWQR
jgi:starch phosphorylase